MFKPKIDRISYGGCLIDQRERDAINNVIDKSNGRMWTLGEESVQFEKELATAAGVNHAVVVNSGSSALLAAITALHLPAGSKVIIPALNFPTAYASIVQNFCVPVVVDCSLENFNLSLDAVKKAIIEHPDVVAVVAVHIAGNVVDMVKLREIVGDRIIIGDNCIAEGTLIKTERGDVPIEQVMVGDRVLTRSGYRKVLKTIDKGFQEVITRFGVTATPDHRFITKHGEKELKTLQPSDILYLWNETSLSIEEKTTSDILMLNKGIEGSTTGAGINRITENFTEIIAEKYQKAISYTIKTIIPSITSYPILRLSLLNSTQGYISRKMGDSISQKGTSLSQEMVQFNGISRKQAKSSTRSTISGFGLLGKKLKKYVQSVRKTMKHIGLTNPYSVPLSVKKVYDLSIEGQHEFFANNILVHNCDGFGGTLHDKMIDTYADISCISMHAAHIISMGEGGAVLTNNEEYARRAKKIREWGRASGSDQLTTHEGLPEDYRERYVYEEVGYNFKPLELQCAMGRVQLTKLDEFKARRHHNYHALRRQLEDIEIFTMVEAVDKSFNCWFGFPFLTKDRPKVMDHFEKHNIETRTVFSGNILRHPAYKNITHIVAGSLENSDYVMKNGMFLSNHPVVTDEMIQYMGEVARDL